MNFHRDQRFSNDRSPTIWLTGLPGAGKTTLGSSLLEKLKENNIYVELLDGDVIRKNLSPELGFTKQDRDLHLKRVVYLCKLLNKFGIVVIVALISPYRDSRLFARNSLQSFVEVWVKCPIEVCRLRDPKGLYRKAQMGQLQSMTGMEDPYEEPLNPEITINTDIQSIEEATNEIWSYFTSKCKLQLYK